MFHSPIPLIPQSLNPPIPQSSNFQIPQSPNLTMSLAQYNTKKKQTYRHTNAQEKASTWLTPLKSGKNGFAFFPSSLPRSNFQHWFLHKSKTVFCDQLLNLSKMSDIYFQSNVSNWQFTLTTQQQSLVNALNRVAKATAKLSITSPLYLLINIWIKPQSRHNNVLLLLSICPSLTRALLDIKQNGIDIFLQPQYCQQFFHTFIMKPLSQSAIFFSCSVSPYDGNQYLFFS